MAAGDRLRVLGAQSAAARRALGAIRQQGQLSVEFWQGQGLVLLGAGQANHLQPIALTSVPAAIGAAGQNQAAAEPSLGEAELCLDSLSVSNELFHAEFF
ncbi:MAG: hypothetical protein DMG76_31480 [Acidobacteria bacterium]|nr:MAG: hypothetical protein DMG76_31480 [Acidobacteriota bacterium]